MIVTEFMYGGSLADAFVNTPFKSLSRAVALMLDCARGMAYLHSRTPLAIIHRDLKPANLMIGGFPTRSDGQRKALVQDYGLLKIADFGLSRSLKLAKSNVNRRRSYVVLQPLSEDAVPELPAPGKPDVAAAVARVAGSSPGGGAALEGAGGMASGAYKMTGETGSYRYMAPEVCSFRSALFSLAALRCFARALVLLGHQSDAASCFCASSLLQVFRHEQYNNKVDVYAFAMICYQIFQVRGVFGV